MQARDRGRQVVCVQAGEVVEGGRNAMGGVGGWWGREGVWGVRGGEKQGKVVGVAGVGGRQCSGEGGGRQCAVCRQAVVGGWEG